ncbi:MAG: hypothetical protein WD069_06115 [Planctomycetales bacterium]
MANPKSAHNGDTRQPPVHIPLDFEQAVEGLIGVKPAAKKKAEPEKKARPKRRKKK